MLHCRQLSVDRVLLAYEDGNIDILYGAPEPEKVINIPDIAEATSVGDSRSIADVAFDADTVYVATSFGLVKMDMAKGETLTSGSYPSSVTGVAVTPSHIVMKCGSKLYSIPKGKRINTLDNFTALTSWGGVAQMTALSPDKLLLRRDTRGRESLYTRDSS